MRRGLLVTAALVASLTAACGGDDDGGGGSSGGNDKMVELIMAQDETEEVAKCFAEELKDFSADDLEKLINEEGEPDAKLGEALSAAGEKCDQG